MDRMPAERRGLNRTPPPDFDRAVYKFLTEAQPLFQDCDPVLDAHPKAKLAQSQSDQRR
jgi:hypothetical protein